MQPKVFSINKILHLYRAIIHVNKHVKLTK